MKKYFITVSTLVFVSVIAFNFYLISQGRSGNDLPKYAKRTPIVEAAYNYSLENPELLEHIPCYCNCYKLGHKNVRDCFIKEFKEDNKVVFDEHGSNCGTCYYTVLDSKDLFEQGQSPQKIREFIDNKYSKYGIGTNTPQINN